MKFSKTGFIFIARDGSVLPTRRIKAELSAVVVQI
jgi:hypothetical protein